jgi:hypothetical protein
MKRFKPPEVEVSQDRNLKVFLPLFILPPTAKKMASFASQFSKPEWDLLCRNPFFVEFLDRDLEKAKTIAGTLLNRNLA